MTRPDYPHMLTACADNVVPPSAPPAAPPRSQESAPMTPEAAGSALDLATTRHKARVQAEQIGAFLGLPARASETVR